MMDHLGPSQRSKDSTGWFRQELLTRPADSSNALDLDPFVDVGRGKSRTTAHEQIAIDRQDATGVTFLDLSSRQVEDVSLDPADVWPEPFGYVEDA
jgi:hypothetical protein